MLTTLKVRVYSLMFHPKVLPVAIWFVVLQMFGARALGIKPVFGQNMLNILNEARAQSARKDNKAV